MHATQQSNAIMSFVMAADAVHTLQYLTEWTS